MSSKQSRYHELEKLVSAVLLADVVLFILYLICAGTGVVWLKVILAILGFLVSAAGVAYLFMTKELFRLRSRWMGVGFIAVALCLLISLICNYPSPNPYKDRMPAKPAKAASAVVMMQSSRF